MLHRWTGRALTGLALAGGLIALAVQPALALSSTPDQTWRTDGSVYAFARLGNTLFVGGSFTQVISPNLSPIGQKSVSNLAAFDVATGTYIPTFTASVLNSAETATTKVVQALAVSSDGSTLYIGGDFNSVDGQSRKNFAAVDTATGTQLSSAVPRSVNKEVSAIVASPSLVYFGGRFVKVDGTPVQHLAAISASDGTLSSAWLPTVAAGQDPCPGQFPRHTNCGPTSNGGNGAVRSLALAPDGNSVYIGGNFYYVNGTPRNCLARVSATDGSLLNWAVPWSTIPSESRSDPFTGPNVVWAIWPTPTRVYVGWGNTPNGFEAYTTSTDASGYVTSVWTDGTPGNVNSLAMSADGTRLYAGGHFGTGVLDYRITSCGSNVWAHGLISVNPTNGAYYCDWIPPIVPFGGQSAPGSGKADPNFIGGWAMRITDNALFVGGYFKYISGVTQSGFARFTLNGTTPTPTPALPSIASFTPTLGPVGTTVTITGTGFRGATGVAFGVGQATSFTVDSDTQIRATVPPGAKTGKIQVTAPGGFASSALSFKVTTLSLSSVTPATGPVGTSVTITGTGFTGATDVSFNGVSATFKVVTDIKITATVPAGATTGLVSVTTPNGTVQSPTAFTVTALSITGLAPASGPVGTSVTITGTGFTGATDVSFNGVSATFKVVTDIKITATVPAGATTGLVSVTTPNGTVQSPTAFTVTALSITGLAPASGPVGTSVTITGTGFTGATDVSFNGVSATFKVVTDSKITATVPAGATTGLVSVTTPNGTVQSPTAFTVTALSITGLAPASGPVGTSVTITGTGFTGATDVSFNGVSAGAGFSVVNDSKITATVPAGATTGLVSVTTPNGTVQSPTAFTVTALSITKVAPTKGPVGTSVTITGTGFTGATDVSFNGVSAGFNVVNDSKITATVPAGATTGLVSVTTPNGTVQSPTAFTVTALSITKVAPTKGPVGTSVTITGTGFTGATDVSFNGVSAGFNVVNDSKITATVPAGATTGLVSVTTPNGTVQSPTAFTVTLSITGLAPTSGPVGTSVTITGTGFTGATDVSFNGVSAGAGFSVDTDSQITATVPAGATTGLVSVTTPNGTVQSPTAFTVTLSITKVAPTKGPVGTSVTITGTGFTGATDVSFNGVSAGAGFSVDTDSQITATVPAGATTGLVSVTTPNGTVQSPTAFTVTLSITKVAPTKGPVGTSVTITGTGFTGATDVSFNGVSAGFNVVNDSKITATVPAGATTGLVSVTTPNGTVQSPTAFTVTLSITGLAPTSGPVGTSVTITGTGFTGATDVSFNGVSAGAGFSVDTDSQITATVPAGATTGLVSVTTPNGTVQSPTAFTVTLSITGLAPTSGPVGTSVTITGTGFTGATDVSFNGVSAGAGFSVDTDSQITATVPAGATTGLVSVTTPNGTVQSPTAFTVTLSITGLAPTSGPVGTSVTITGTGFTGATDVSFNGVSAGAGFSVDTDSQITATVPAGATTGLVSVTTPNGTVQSPTAFTVT